MKMFTYLRYDGFFNLLDDLPCQETRRAISTIVTTLRNFREYAEAARSDGGITEAETFDVCADELSEQLENYICAYHKQLELAESCPEHPESN